MEQQLRLAERRGIYQKPLSVPGEFGLMIVMMLDDRTKTERDVNMVKSALVGNDPARLTDLFPQWTKPDTVEAGSAEAERALASGDAIEDWSEFQFQSPSDMGESEMEEMMRLSRALADSAQVSVAQDSGGSWV